jgi:putative membrane protein
MKMQMRMLLALPLGASLLACDAEEGDVSLASQDDELGVAVDAGSAVDAGEGSSKHKDWAAALACVSPRLKDCADGQIAAIVTAANVGEVELSKALHDKLTTEPARALAKQLIEEHTKAQAELKDVLAKSGISPIENGNSKHLTEMNKVTIEALSKKSGVELDGDFVAHQLLQHAQVIGTLDHVLLPSVKDPALETYLRKVRGEVGDHTKDIAKTQAAVQGPCGDGKPVDAGVAASGGSAPPPVPVLDAGVQK